MCGIAGIVGSGNDGRISHEVLHTMCQAMVHRGPDEEGIFVKSGAALGMRRLSVIDLAGGSQPIFNEDRTVWVVFNGEIYNFGELREELEHRGHKFRSHTDTEVIVHLYEDSGADCVHKLRGMFALALFDEPERRLLLARDRLGKKPLHYAVIGDQLLFASEIKSILAVAPALADINERALRQYFLFGYIPDPATAFSAIQKLPPGHLLEFENGEVRVRQYWDLPEYGDYFPDSEEECLEQLEAKLAEAVRIRLIADVPLGALLSGGTDSSTIVALMARASSGPVKTFSVGFKSADFNEAHHARLVAERFSTEHHELILEPNVVDTVETLSRSLEEPFGDSSMLPMYYVSCLARKHVTVVLSGDGGDEIFGGYDRYRIHLQERERYHIPEWAGRWYRTQIYPWLRYGTPGRNFAYSVSLPWPERYVEAVSLLPAQRNFTLLSHEFMASFPDEADLLNLFHHYLEKAPASDPLSRVLYLDTKTYLPGDILTKVDRMSMAVSLEVRSPLLDHRLAEFAARLSPDMKIRNSTRKYLLKEMVLREKLLPREVVFRKKHGFGVPIDYWFRGESKLLAEQMIERAFSHTHFGEVIRDRPARKFMKSPFSNAAKIFAMTMLALWYQMYVDGTDSVPSFDIEKYT